MRLSSWVLWAASLSASASALASSPIRDTAVSAAYRQDAGKRDADASLSTLKINLYSPPVSSACRSLDKLPWLTCTQSSEGHPHIRNIRAVNRVTRRYRRRGFAGPEIDEREAIAAVERSLKTRATPVKRTNTYHIVSAATPTSTDSMAVDEDGTDYSYFSSVKFGSGGTPMYMLLDTGASNTWVMGSDCQSKACQSHDTFGPGDSKSLLVSNSPFSITYGTGTVGGFIANDTVSFAGMNFQMEMGLANQTSDDFLSFPQDGILGLGRPRTNDIGVPALMEVIGQDKLLKNNLFGVHLQRDSDGTNDGEISFGDVDTSRFDGDLTWVPAMPDGGLWEVPVDDAGVDGNSSHFANSNKTAVIDTGTSFVLLPPKDAQQLLAGVPGMQQNGETFEVPCGSTAPIQITFGGATFNISAKDYVGAKSNGNGDLCAANIIGRQAFGSDTWLLGDVFLKNVYSVFDFDKDRVGFGAKAASGASPTSSASSSSKTSSASSSTGTTKPSASGTASPSTSSSSSASSSPSASKDGKSKGDNKASLGPKSFAMVLSLPSLILIWVILPVGLVLGIASI
ncbi:MAG: hypothetical protein M1819_005989 [Sarea resinae]|nr:MAG: hypothetical protein M1819_005989 [Sarea resinae]